ncbi:aldose 1-epimerase family protein [Lacticaseibacillus daqingensis]|uniref:aldose 1-epimerase family protein n=1 Tax=Lacticaseibacillus daqingensis TaxID=2486014 RepID=UPI000F79BA63|nr:aldose 1-epimerase family protein [Lacticaseibacillus daqingensis]
MITLENSQFTATISADGAELTTLSRKADKRQVIWTDETGQYWQRHAPVLFPVIGRSNQDQYTLDGTVYPMRQHGFARDMRFQTITQDTDDTVALTLHATDATNAQYPFDFALTITYHLTTTGLQITYAVVNHDRRPMPFALGFHPAFTLTQPMDAYTVTLHNATLPLHKFGVGPLPFRNGEIEPLKEADGAQLALTHERLNHGLILIDAPEATGVTLARTDGKESLTLSLTDFPYLAIWSPADLLAPFVCLEPFNGLPDQIGAPTNWYQKAGNMIAAPGETRQFGLTMRLD